MRPSKESRSGLKENLLIMRMMKAADGERNINRLCNWLLVNGRQRKIGCRAHDQIVHPLMYNRGDVEREERRVAERYQNLERYKREMGK